MSTEASISNWQFIALIIVLAFVIILPLASRKIEHNIELFLFIAGGLVVTISNTLSIDLAVKILKAPFAITITVLIFGLAFYFGRDRLDRTLGRITGRAPLPIVIFLIVLILGLLSSVITAVIASLLLVEIVMALKLSRAQAVRVVVLSCFSIGLGAALTPIGEPLSTVVIARLDEDFFYLFRSLGIYIVPLVACFGVAAVLLKPSQNGAFLYDWEPEKTVWTAFERAGKVYAFVCALLMLGAGLEPLANAYINPLPGHLLFWVNMISAVLDNATLAAAEITPTLHPHQISGALLGLLTSGGMLIPGNIPNIIAAGHLRITAREWAMIGIPVGLVLMAVTFFAWLALAR
jgi:predicted cation transporter